MPGSNGRNAAGRRTGTASPGRRRRMRTIGILGGVTWHSSAEYYRQINTLANERLGGKHAARCILFSVDLAVMDELMATGRWKEAGQLLSSDAAAVERAGAELFIL